ncbi:MAG: MFS transporter [Thermoplasmataceae archaeon]
MKPRKGVASVTLQALIFMVLGNFSNASYSPLAPFIKNYFLLSSVQLGLITSVIFSGAMVVSLLSGLFVDRFGSSTAIKIAFGTILLGSFVNAVASSYIILLFGYFLIGFGYGIITPSTNRIVMETYYPEHSTPMGIKQSGVPLGALIAAIVLTFLALHYGIKGAFLAMVAVSGAVFLAVRRNMNNGSVSSISKGYISDLFSGARDHILIVISLVSMFLSWGQQTLLTYFVVYMEYRNYAVGISEILLAVLLMGSVFGRIFYAKLSDILFNRNRATMLALIMALSSASLILLALLPTNIGLDSLLAFFLGMNVVAWNGTYVTLISEIAPANKIGLYSGISLMILNVGTIAGTPLSGWIIDETGSYLFMWIAVALSLSILSIITTLPIGRMVRERLTSSL